MSRLFIRVAVFFPSLPALGASRDSSGPPLGSFTKISSRSTGCCLLRCVRDTGGYFFIVIIIIWLNPRASKMKILIGYPSGQNGSLGISCVDPARKYSLFGHIISPLLTKLVLSRWLNISLILFCVFIDLDVVLVNKSAKELANIQPSWLNRPAGQ